MHEGLRRYRSFRNGKGITNEKHLRREALKPFSHCVEKLCFSRGGMH